MNLGFLQEHLGECAAVKAEILYTRDFVSVTKKEKRKGEQKQSC